MTFWKEAGIRYTLFIHKRSHEISYLKYATVSAHALRKVLKEDIKMQALKREEYYVKMAPWTAGKPGATVMLAEKSRD